MKMGNHVGREEEFRLQSVSESLSQYISYPRFRAKKESFT